MKKLVLVMALAGLAGCAGSGLRYTYFEIEKLPAETRDSIRRGEVMIGMSPVAVRYALGAPERSRTIAPEEGRLQEEWMFRSNLGLKKIFVIFENSEVVRIETEERKFPTIRLEEPETGHEKR